VGAASSVCQHMRDMHWSKGSYPGVAVGVGSMPVGGERTAPGVPGTAPGPSVRCFLLKRFRRACEKVQRVRRGEW
jgi:hypothetical protein